MNMTPEEYNELTKQSSPRSPFIKDFLLAFTIGGLICALGQAIMMAYQSSGMPEEVSGSVTSVTLVLLSIILTGFNIYPKIAKFGGAGTLVPITGFANAVASPALEFKSEGLVLGLAAKMFVIAGPVIVYGTSASIVYGLIIYLFGLY